MGLFSCCSKPAVQEEESEPEVEVESPPVPDAFDALDNDGVGL
ncbi:hypothetical protein KIPB_013254, partial [Kipferlia bialata]|eukprot:g13254.t1